MVPAKKSPATALVPIKRFRKHLEYLYARRTAIDELIESLESYNRLRGKSTESRRRRTA